MNIIAAEVEKLAKSPIAGAAGGGGLALAPRPPSSPIIEHFGDAHLRGIAAVSDRLDRPSLGKVNQNTAYECALPAAIRDGFPAPNTARLMPVEVSLGSVRVMVGAGGYGSDQTLVAWPLCRISKVFADALDARGVCLRHAKWESCVRAQALDDTSQNITPIRRWGTYGVRNMRPDPDAEAMKQPCLIVLEPNKPDCPWGIYVSSQAPEYAGHWIDSFLTLDSAKQFIRDHNIELLGVTSRHRKDRRRGVRRWQTS